MFEEITKTTYNNIASDYSRNTIFPEFRDLICKSATRFKSIIPNNRKKNLLVLGSGDGRDALLFSNIFKQIILYDYSEEMMTIAKRRLPHAQYLVEDFRHLHFYFKKNSIDAVWASTCLYHIQKSYLPNVLKDLYDIIKPGGIIYINLKIGNGEGLINNPNSFPLGGARFYAFYSKKEILYFVRNYITVYIRSVNPEIDIPYIQLILKK